MVALACACISDTAPEARVGFLIEAGPRTRAELGIATWDVRLGESGVTIGALSESGSPRGELRYAMRSQTKDDVALVAEALLARRGQFTMSRRGIEEDSLTRIHDASRWVFAVRRDVTATPHDVETYGSATACAEHLRASTRSCANALMSCRAGDRDPACLGWARRCAADCTAADECQRRSP